MIYQINNATVQYGADVILDNIRFEIKNKKEKIAVVGRNGCGKSTLLKLISGEVDMTHIDGVDSNISKTGNPTIGILRQLTFDDNDITLDDEIRKVFNRYIKMQERLEELVGLMNEEADTSPALEPLAEEYTNLQEEFHDLGGYFYEKEYDMMLKSFGFSYEDKLKKLSEFSGGQRTKLAFIKLLLSKPDILLLDEPTNHLDITTIQWLENYLKSYNRAVVVVSHDRMFLDKIVDTVYEIEHHRMRRYSGNYSTFVKLKKEAYEVQMKEHLAQQKEIKRLEGIADRFMAKPTKVSMAKSKLKAIEHMDIIEAPDQYDTESFHANFTPRIESGKDCLMVKDLSIGYTEVLSTLSFEVKRNDRLGIIGGNGLGKSTLLKTLVNDIEALSGEYKYGTNVEVGYFDQQMAQYTSDKSILDDFWDTYPNLKETEVRNCLGAFLFTGDDVYKEVSALSGGEKVRLALAKIFKNKPNFLILDEPTNHMDIVGKETLESMLVDFPGTVVFVSHDRYFVKKVATRLLSMEQGQVKMYEFGYDQYEEELKALESEELTGFVGGKIISTDSLVDSQTIVIDKKVESITPQDSIGKAKQSYFESKETAKLERKRKKLEEEIEALEQEIDKKKLELSDENNATSYMKLQDIQGQIDGMEEKLLELMSKWDEI